MKVAQLLEDEDIAFHLRMMERRLNKHFPLALTEITHEHVQLTFDRATHIYVAVPTTEGNEGRKWDIWVGGKPLHRIPTKEVISKIESALKVAPMAEGLGMPLVWSLARKARLAGKRVDVDAHLPGDIYYMRGELEGVNDDSALIFAFRKHHQHKFTDREDDVLTLKKVPTENGGHYLQVVNKEGSEPLEEDATPRKMLVVSLLQKLLAKNEKVKVKLEFSWDHEKKKAIPHKNRKDEIFDVTRLEHVDNPPLRYSRIYTTAPEEWFELNPEDDEVVQLRKQPDGTWLLSLRDGSGIAV